VVRTGIAEQIGLFASGFALWTFAEYVLHGWLGHASGGAATGLHRVHHRDPHAVFTIGAWLPIAIVWAAAVAILGWTPPTILLSGIVCGFALYETVHYRMHFRLPGSAFERYLRTRHLRHHRAGTNVCIGVTSPLWDLIFRTEPPAHAGPALSVAPLTGRTNVRLVLSFHYLRGAGR